MANISAYLQAIMNAVYGEEVRGSIHDAISIINDVGEKVITIGTDVTSSSSSTEGYFNKSLYLNNSTWDLWECTGSAWVKRGNIRGIVSIVKTSESGLNDIYTITYTDGSTSTFTVTNGNGVFSVQKTGSSGLVDTYTITFDDGSTSTFMVTNGADGTDGFSPTVSVSKTGKDTAVTITTADGPTTFHILDGADGQGSGDMLTSVYDTDQNGIVDAADSVPWSGVTGKNNAVDDMTTDINASNQIIAKGVAIYCTINSSGTEHGANWLKYGNTVITPSNIQLYLVYIDGDPTLWAWNGTSYVMVSASGAGGLVSILQADFDLLPTADKNDPDIWWWISDGDGPGGTGDYTQLTNKPSINGVEINGAMTSSTLHLAGEINTGTVTFKQYGNENIVHDFPENSSATIKEGAERFNDYRQRTGTSGNGTLAIGLHSHAEGNCTLAYGDKSHAEGENCVAGGTTSHAEGNQTYGKGNSSHAEGDNTLASGQASHAEGKNTKATNNNAHAGGRSSEAIGENTFAHGNRAKASAYDAFALGEDTLACANHCMAIGKETQAGNDPDNTGTSSQNGEAAFAEGNSTVASGNASHAEGAGTIAQGASQHAGGHWNVASNGSSGGTSGDAFIIGNGSTNTTRSNAFRVTFAGAVYGKSAYNSSGADYAEFFEWVDGNKKAEDRVGYFVTLDGNKIKIANPGDYILGVVSGHPSVIGNGDEEWTKRWERDEFGRILQERKEDKERNETITCWVQNPKYDVNKVYIERKDRIEWDTIAMLGVVEVRDDGTCKVNGYCDVSNGGIATKTDKGYRVISRVTDNVIKIIFR